MGLDLDSWIERPVVRVHHRREADVDSAVLWAAARTIELRDTAVLGRLVRVRIPGLSPDVAYNDLFRAPPFTVLEGRRGVLVAGLVGRIWTLRRDYPTLAEPDDFRHWSDRGTVRVLFATWVEPAGPGRTALFSEVRVDAVDRRARIGLGALRPLISRYQNLIGSDGLEVAVERACEMADGADGTPVSPAPAVRPP